jgi:hypothetical protein
MAGKQLAKAKRRVPKLPVLNNVTSIDAQRGYRHGIEEFIESYGSEPRLSFSKTLVLRYCIQLESRHLASGIVNLCLATLHQRTAAKRRLAAEYHLDERERRP